MHRHAKIATVLRTALAESPLPLASIARAAGVERSSLSRFLAERSSLRLDKADRLAASLGFQLTQFSRPE
ncbi:MAG: hypothetical protein ACKV2Q_14470 [Planctomycetaceae bacterium]